MIYIYIPILKEKQGEKDALNQLKNQTKDNIIPLFEISPDHFSNANNNFLNTCWRNRLFYLDFPNESVAEGISDEIFNSWFTNQNNLYVIPVLHLTYDILRIKQIVENSKNGIALRITLDEFFEEDFDFNFNQIIRLIATNQVDIIIDAQEVNEIDYKKQAATVKNCIEKINDNIFKNIIIASGSFPNSLQIEKDQLVLLPKVELKLFKSVIQQTSLKNLIYGDYGINHWTYFNFIPGMQPSFNIRYTLFNDFLVYKGKTIKKGGLTLENIRAACESLVNSKHFMGKDFSWGDTCITDIADGTRGSGGNLTTWRAIATNHHIETVVSQLSNPLET